jgi:AraC-like DNA-binding protein
MEWKLPALFTDRILNGEILFESSEDLSIHDEFLFSNWIKEVEDENSIKTIQLEMRARLSRMANNSLDDERINSTPIHLNEISQIERITVYIARNYANPIKTSDIGNAVGLHPDYANSIFKKAFGVTLSEYITEERISHAQRKLAASDMSITEIALDCGFNSVNRFNAAFKKINNCTPREFRKGYNKEF